MEGRELKHILGAMIIVFAVAGFGFVLKGEYASLPMILFFAVLIILVSVFSKKFVANALDADVEHRVLGFSRWGFKPHQRLKKEIPAGIILPLFLSLFSLGFVKFMGILSYEAKALKRRAARRFGFYSYTELTEWHNALIGAGGILGVLVLAVVAYFAPIGGLESLAKMSAFYAFSNIIPILDLDGTQIFFGSRVLWTTLAIICTIFGLYAMFLV